jgi:hypothetical protein
MHQSGEGTECDGARRPRSSRVMQQVRHTPFLLRVSTLPRRTVHPQARLVLIYPLLLALSSTASSLATVDSQNDLKIETPAAYLTRDSSVKRF